MNLFTYPEAMPQFLAATSPATSNNASPIIVIAGAIVIGVMYFRTSPTMPVLKSILTVFNGYSNSVQRF